MSQDDDDIGGGTLVMPPEEHPVPHEGASPAPLASTPLQSASIDDPESADGPGTFIMSTEHHATRPNPASPFADSSRARGNWPAAVVGARPPSNPTANFVNAPTVTGDNQAVLSAAAEIVRQRGPEAAAPPYAPVAPPSFGAPPDPRLAHESQPRGLDLAAEPHRIDAGPIPDARELHPGGPTQPFPTDAFPRPGSFPSGAGSTPPKSGALGPLLLGAAVGLGTVVVVVGGFYAYRGYAGRGVTTPSGGATTHPSSSAEARSSATAATPSAAPSGTAAPSASTTPSPRAPAEGSEASARAALAALADGIKKCTAETIHVLPGTSPAVPTSVAWLKKGPYEPGLRDFVHPVFACTRFKISDPMPYVIQWQSDVPGKKGTAVAWLDDDGDGVADRALGFTATLAKRNVAEIGPIEDVDPTRKIKRR